MRVCLEPFRHLEGCDKCIFIPVQKPSKSDAPGELYNCHRDWAAPNSIKKKYQSEHICTGKEQNNMFFFSCCFFQYCLTFHLWTLRSLITKTLQMHRCKVNDIWYILFSFSALCLFAGMTWFSLVVDDRHYFNRFCSHILTLLFCIIMGEYSWSTGNDFLWLLNGYQ